MKTSQLLKVLSSKNKTKIIMKLMNCECNNFVISLCDELNLKQANLSKHLMDLKDLNIVSYQRVGKNCFYKLEDNFKKQNESLLKEISKISNEPEYKIFECDVKGGKNEGK